MFLHIGLVKGLNEVLKALDRKQALIAVLAADCEDAKYKKFVTVSIQQQYFYHAEASKLSKAMGARCHAN